VSQDEFPSSENPLKLNSTELPFPRVDVFPSGPPKSGSAGSGVFVGVGVAVDVGVDVCVEVAVKEGADVAVGD